MTFEENGNILTIVGATKIVNYTLVKNEQKVNEQQYTLPEGSNIVYPDGAKFMHCGDYALFRNWECDGKVFDRVAIPWSMLYLQLD